MKEAVPAPNPPLSSELVSMLNILRQTFEDIFDDREEHRRLGNNPPSLAWDFNRLSNAVGRVLHVYGPAYQTPPMQDRKDE